MREYTQEEMDDVCRRLIGDGEFGSRPLPEPALVIQVVEYGRPWWHIAAALVGLVAAMAVFTYVLWETLPALR